MAESLREDVINRTELMPGETYFVQCMSHNCVGIARPGSLLEILCEERERRGLIDAYILRGPEQCPECYEELMRKWRNYCENILPWEEPEDRLTFAKFSGIEEEEEELTCDQAVSVAARC